MMKKLKVAQIGIRHEHASGKMWTLRRQLTDVMDLVGVAPDSPADLETFGKDKCYDNVKWMSRDEVLQLPDLDMVLVETEMTDLVETSRMCLERKLPVHCDKPGGETLEPYAKLVRDFEKAKVPFQIAYMLRSSMTVNFMLRACREGWLGEIFEVDGNMHRNDSCPHFRSFLAKYQGGGLFDFGSHIIDVLMLMLGAPDDIVSFQQKISDDELTDNGLAVFVYPKALATMRCCERSPNGIPDRRFTVRGTKGWMEIYPLEQGYDPELGHPTFNKTPVNIHMFLTEDNREYAAGTYSLKLGAMNDRYEDQLREFAKIVRGEIANPYSAEYEIMVQRAVLAASGYLTWK